MTRQDAKDSMGRIGKVLGVVLAALAVLGAAKTGAEWWLVPQSAYKAERAKDDLRYQRDSLVMRKVERWVDYQNCKEFCTTRPRNELCNCLRPDRP
jgi:hypothetical protein